MITIHRKHSLLVRNHRTHLDIFKVFLHHEFSAISEAFQHLLKVIKENLTKYHKYR